MTKRARRRRRESAGARRARIPNQAALNGNSIRKRIGAYLEMVDERLAAFAAFVEPGRAIAARRPQPPRLPPAIWIVDPTVEPLRVEAHRIRHAQDDPFAVDKRQQRVVLVPGRNRHVIAETKRVVLIDPSVVARLGAVLADAVKAGTGILVERPALGASIPGRVRSVERTLAFAAIEAAEMAAAERHPDHALAVDIAAARTEAGHWDVIDLGERRRRRVGPERNAYYTARAAQDADRSPDRTVSRTWHDGVEPAANALVLGRIDRLVGLDIVGALPVAFGIEHEGGPALRLGRIAGFVELLRVEPAENRPAAARPQRVIRIEAKFQMMRIEARIDESIFHRLRIEVAELAPAFLKREKLRRWLVRALLAEIRIFLAA